jgi:hypothetical protein
MARSSGLDGQAIPSWSARALMAEESLVDAISKALAKAPPLTPAMRERILGLLS